MQRFAIVSLVCSENRRRASVVGRPLAGGYVVRPLQRRRDRQAGLQLGEGRGAVAAGAVVPLGPRPRAQHPEHEDERLRHVPLHGAPAARRLIQQHRHHPLHRSVVITRVSGDRTLHRSVVAAPFTGQWWPHGSVVTIPFTGQWWTYASQVSGHHIQLNVDWPISVVIWSASLWWYM